ncbi:hypothetical protein GCM10028801_31510 [Nocardioides maradonensis]
MADDIPASVRREVAARDNWTLEGQAACRVCGQWLETPGLHHIRFRSQGGLHVPENLVTVGWAVGSCDCHLRIAHGQNARYWRDILLAIAGRPELTALQVHRWSETRPRQ